MYIYWITVHIVTSPLISLQNRFEKCQIYFPHHSGFIHENTKNPYFTSFIYNENKTMPDGNVLYVYV